MTKLTMFRGDTLPMTAAIVLAGTTTPVNLTGGSLRFTLKTNPADPDSAEVLGFTSPARITIPDPTTGVATWTLQHADLPAYATALPAPVQFYWDLQLTDSGGNVYTVDSGILVLNQDISITSP